MTSEAEALQLLGVALPVLGHLDVQVEEDLLTEQLFDADPGRRADLAQPGTTDEPRANPETLFAAGYAACFQGALANRAKTVGIDTSDSTVTAEVSFGPSEDGGFGIAVELKVHIPDVDEERAREVVAMAHQFCPYSKATRDNIDVVLTIV